MMPISKSASARIQVHFATLPDPRRRKVTHPLINFIVIAICGCCGSPMRQPDAAARRAAETRDGAA